MGKINLAPVARALRRDMTKEERHLWYDFLKSYPLRFYRQRPIGRFVLDFYCARAKLVIELDGSQHYEPEGLARDAERTAWLQGYGLHVLRIPNNEINQNFRSVCEYIDSIVKQRVAERER